MLFFDRRRDIATASPSPDTALAPLCVQDARWLVATACGALRSEGTEVTYDGMGMLQGMDGRSYSLTNIAAILGVIPRRRWTAAVAEHVDALLAAGRNRAPESLADIEALVLPRLTPTGALAGNGYLAPGYARPFAPDLHVLAALDYPTHVSTLGAEAALDAFGGWSTVMPLAIRNLRALDAPDHEVVHGDDTRTDSDVYVFESEDYHGATRVLLITELLAAYAGVEAPRHGSLVVIPDRHLLAIHPISGPGLVSATQLLVDIALTEYGDSPGRMSPHVYYHAPDGTVEQISRREGDGLVMSMTRRFGAALADLGILGS